MNATKTQGSCIIRWYEWRGTHDWFCVTNKFSRTDVRFYRRMFCLQKFIRDSGKHLSQILKIITRWQNPK